MAKKESPKERLPVKDDLEAFKAEAPPSKLAGLSSHAFSIIKLLLGISFLPFIYSSTVSFFGEFSLIEKALQNTFWSGLITLLIIYLFVWEPTIIYIKGSRLLELIFSFFRPMVRVAPYLLPIYTIILFLLYGVLTFFSKSGALISALIFLTGSSSAFHLIFSAKSIRSKQKDFLKANYLFGFSLVYIINLFLLSFCFNLIFEKFSFVNFSNNTWQAGSSVFNAIFKQLFL
ncbi:MAG: hypothetical protein FJZ11_03440 [Candidatus Omnitrophica bacterium]|nr:hypothetical protein [Candidatus Omnitrophota bacterium]